ncbi:amino acid--tRNA ligase-related protein [Actinophytocola sp. NPDC049390]|uniref:amino acid--tRNA ligase-related protein n=1 Tax=Actinophytocola sp. NPDC049390 TaxID=3363894 RepID=UPI00378AE7D8
MSQTSITGRLYSIRAMGKHLTFATLRCPDREYLCVFSERLKVRAESIVRVTGETRPSTGSRAFDDEIAVESYEVVAENRTIASTRLAGQPYSKAVLPDQHVYMRLPEVRARLLAKWSAVRRIRDVLTEQRFVEVQSPRIVGRMTDGPTMKFKLDYFGRDAYLSLSNLLFHTAFVAGDFTSVFEVSPLFRADVNHSSQHLSEFLILEATAAYRSREDMMRLSEDVVRAVCEDCGGGGLPAGHLDDIPVVTYEELRKIVSRADCAPVAPGTRIKRYHAEAVATHLDRTLFWVVDMPAKHKAFFSSTRHDPATGTDVANDFRLYWREIDIVDGGERVTSPERLRERLAEQDLDPAHFGYYLDVLAGGVPPLTGLGLGIERLLAKALGIGNIRQLVPFPRYVDHFEP